MLKTATKLLALGTFGVLLTVAIFSDQVEESFNLPNNNNELVQVASIEKTNEPGMKPLILSEKSQQHTSKKKLGLAGFLIIVGGFTGLGEKKFSDKKEKLSGDSSY